MAKSRIPFTKRSVSIVECLVGMVIFIVAIMPLWTLMNDSYGQITVTVDDLMISIASSCLVNEISTMSFPELEKIMAKNIYIGKKNIYGIEDLDVTIALKPVDSADNDMLYDFINVTITFIQMRKKPKLQERKFHYNIVVPRLY